MSTNRLLIERINKKINEVIDLNDIKPIQLNINQYSEFEFNGNIFSMTIEKFQKGDDNILPIHHKPESLEGFYNFGFNMNDIINRTKKRETKDLVKPLVIIVKSLIVWLENNDVEFLTLFSDSENIEEKRKKIILWGAILNREKSKLVSMGYFWDFFMSPVYEKSIFIKKINN